MKDAHLTLRLPADLDRALTRWAKRHRVPKSHVAREAVARFLDPTAAEATGTVTARELLVRWTTVPRLDPAEAASLASEISAARGELPTAKPAWE